MNTVSDCLYDANCFITNSQCDSKMLLMLIETGTSVPTNMNELVSYHNHISAY